MAIQYFTPEQQAKGSFNGGAILENKPFGFPGEGGNLAPIGNIFYWAHAWSDGGSTIGEHPHKGFEIMTFVLEGNIEHYDSLQRKWLPLKKGDVQIIRSGSGVSHAERMHAGAHLFQIWLDPNLSQTLEKPASYDDYRASQFHTEETGGLKTIEYAGEKGKIEMDSSGITIQELQFQPGEYRLDLGEDEISGIYWIDGEGMVGDISPEKDGFFLINDQKAFTWKASTPGRIFRLSGPQKVDFQTYAEMRGFAMQV